MVSPSGTRNLQFTPAGAGKEPASSRPRQRPGIVEGAGGLREILSRAGARINESCVAQPPPRLEIKRWPFALRVGTEVAAAVRPFHPTKAEPLEVFDHRARKLGTRTLRIEVFVAQDQGSTALGGTLRGDPKGARMPDVQKPGGRRCEASAISGGRRHRRILNRVRPPITTASSPFRPRR